MPDNPRSWIGQRMHNFAEGWRQHPFQHAISTVAGMAGGPLAGRGLQAAFDARNRSINRDAGNRGVELGNAMQQSLDQRIWGNPSPQTMTENYGPWAGGYRGASVPQPQGSMADALGVPDYAGNQVPDSPMAPQRQDQGGGSSSGSGFHPVVVQNRPSSAGTGGGLGHGWSGTSDPQMMGMIMDSLGLANAGTLLPDGAKVWLSKAVK